LKLRQPRTTKKKPAQLPRKGTGRAEDELKANLHALSLVPEDDVEMTEPAVEEEDETTFRMEDISASLDLPQKRFNAALAVGMDDKLYIYGGTFEVPGRGEVTLDDFHVIDLGKLDGVRQLWNRTVIEEEEEEEEESDEEDDDEEMSDDEAEPVDRGVTQPMQVDTPQQPEPEPVEESLTSFNPSYPQPLPFETLKAYYDRTAKDWLELVPDKSKAGRREAFLRAEGYWWETREEIREIEEQMEESGVKEVLVAQADRKDKRR
jgi:Domain of unknown function (DUF4110)